MTAFGLDRSLVFRSLPEARAAVSAEGVIDVTPPAFHREISTPALEAGLPVLSEKPLASTLADTAAIIQKANETGVLHIVEGLDRLITLSLQRRKYLWQLNTNV